MDHDEIRLAEAKSLAESALAFVQSHEREQHDGDHCHSERVDTVTFIAYVLGLRLGDIQDVRESMARRCAMTGESPILPFEEPSQNWVGN